MSKLGDALRDRFKHPKDALRALGLDENLLEERSMSTNNAAIAKEIAARAARQVSVAALMTYLKPRIAQDAGIDYGAVFDGVTGNKFKSMKGEIAKRVRTQVGKKIAKDASLDQVEQVLDMLDAHEIDGGDESVSKEQHNAMAAAAGGNSDLGIPEKVGKEFADADKGKAFDAEGFKNFLKEKGMGEDDISTAMGMMPKAAASDEEDEEAKKKREQEEAKKAEDKKAMDDAEKKDMVSKPAMDAAIQAAVTAERANGLALTASLEFVRPWVGALSPTLGLDSAEKVHRQALKILKVDGADTIHPSALMTIIGLQPKPHAQAPEHRQHMALDSTQVADFAKRFPGSDSIGFGG